MSPRPHTHCIFHHFNTHSLTPLQQPPVAGEMKNLISSPYLLLLLLSLTHLSILELVSSQFDYPTANLSTTWTNHVTAPHSISYTDGSTIRAILLRETFGPRYACGFFCNGDCVNYLFAIFIVQTNSGGIVQPSIGFPQVVWSANRDSLVSLNSTLKLTSDGDLVLTNADGVNVWSTNTSGKSVIGMNLTEIGNLVLYNSRNETVWQSFDYPTDVLVPGQKLLETQTLVSSVSSTNWSRGLLSISVSSNGLLAYIEANPPQPYYQSVVTGNKTSVGPSYLMVVNGSLSMYIFVEEPNDPNDKLWNLLPSFAQYMKLESNGHLRVYEWKKGASGGWGIVTDLLTGYLGECNYPIVCGKYGVCYNGQCTCPAGSYSNGTRFFELVNDRQPDLGCSATSSLNCSASEYHEFLELKDVTYFSFVTDIHNTDMKTCKEACMSKCSCKAAIFRYGFNASGGSCYLPEDIFSLMNNEKDLTHYNATAFVKIQQTPPTVVAAPTGSKNSRKMIIIGASLGAFFGVALIIGLVFVVILRKRKEDIDEEEYLDKVPGMPTRFSYEELKLATNDFTAKLGEGGFGSVFEGKLDNGTRIAVKILDGIGHVKKSFLAEVETIGSVHHINLVTLIGFCAEKSHRGLVYEYMPNGSLEKWIFKPKSENVLDWSQRKKIILDIAKGLTYLHEDCRQKIIHLDIKPQNILLDEKLNAKVSDFGLSKLIDKDQSNVMTTMRGTPGYLAPEWLNSVITEKVDVYSFGIVVLEILCGRKNLDRSQVEEEMHLLSLFKSKGEENMLFDLVDKCSDDMLEHGEEVAEMMRIAAWCLQSDFAKRPAMSVVVKVLEGVMEVDESMDYKLVAQTEDFKPAANRGDDELRYESSTPLLPSILSGPR